jgi:hypothetical protein
MKVLEIIEGLKFLYIIEQRDKKTYNVSTIYKINALQTAKTDIMRNIDSYSEFSAGKEKINEYKLALNQKFSQLNNLRYNPNNYYNTEQMMSDLTNFIKKLFQPPEIMKTSSFEENMNKDLSSEGFLYGISF